VWQFTHVVDCLNDMIAAAGAVERVLFVVWHAAHVAVTCLPAKNDLSAFALMCVYFVTANVVVEWHRSHSSGTSPRCGS